MAISYPEDPIKLTVHQPVASSWNLVVLSVCFTAEASVNPAPLQAPPALFLPPHNDEQWVLLAVVGPELMAYP